MTIATITRLTFHGHPPTLWRSILLLAAGAAFAVGIITSRPPSGSAPTSQTSTAGTVSMRLSDMDDGLALRVADGAGRAIPIAQVHASAALLRDGEGIIVMPFSEMNGDHLMVRAGKGRPARLVVGATVNGRSFNAPFALPLGSPSQAITRSEESHGIH